jgi:hypothetical protein
MTRVNGDQNDRVRIEFYRAVDNSTRYSKRSLLDFIDFQRLMVQKWLRKHYPDTAAELDAMFDPLFDFLKKRVHNDVSMIRDQVFAAFQIYLSGGIIPPFGGRAPVEDPGVPVEAPSKEEA